MGRGSQRLCNQNVIYLGFNKKDFPWVINKMSCGELFFKILKTRVLFFGLFVDTDDANETECVLNSPPPPPFRFFLSGE